MRLDEGFGQTRNAGDPGPGDHPAVVPAGAFTKHNTHRRPYRVANEYLAHRLGVAAGLPMASGGLAGYPSGPGGLIWFSVGPLTGTVPAPADRHAVAADDPDRSAGIVVFDALILNPDRHPGNLVYLPAAPPPRVRLFDHASALFGEPAGGAIGRIAASERELGVRSMTAGSEHCLLDLVGSPEALLAWAARLASRLPDDLVQDELERTVELGLGPTSEEADRMATFLLRRRDRLPELMYRHRRQFQAISDSAWTRCGLPG